MGIACTAQHSMLEDRGGACPQAASGGIGRYIKKKSLDPLETYVPAVLQARSQLLAAGTVMGKHNQPRRCGGWSGVGTGFSGSMHLPPSPKVLLMNLADLSLRSWFSSSPMFQRIVYQL